MPNRAVYIAATGQNVGKSTISLGILAGLNERFGHGRVGFIKPVGQRHVEVEDGMIVDKDVELFKGYFGISTPYRDMSPVILPRGHTRRYLDGAVTTAAMEQQVIDAYQRIRAAHDYTVVEGTGHTGVGSIVGLNNAKVARLLGLEMVIIVPGGLGSAVDRLALNFAMAAQEGVKIRGVILNRVKPSKREMILEYVPKALKRWDVPLIGCLPYDPILGTPNLADFEYLFRTKLIAGTQHRLKRFHETHLVATSVETFLEYVGTGKLIITPATREDIVLATCDSYRLATEQGEPGSIGLILTGALRGPSDRILERIKRADVPSLYIPMASYDVMRDITNFIAKTRKEDRQKIGKAVDIVSEYVDFDALQTPVG
jgi:BioD-like phosphotransacetylase family protein